MPAAPEEFEPFAQLNLTLRYWWVIALCAVLGGAAGLVAHLFKPPLYEAQAVISASIDLNKVAFLRMTPNPEKMHLFTQDDEDLALMLVKAALSHVEPDVLEFARAHNWDVSAESLHASSTIERKHALWLVRYRSSNPVQAQEMTNAWVQAGYANLQERQKQGLVPAYVILGLESLADVPRSPSYFQRNTFALAGLVCGLVLGMLLVNLRGRRS